MVLQVLVTNAAKYSKGLLSEILDFVMGQGLIPADGDVWKVRRRAIVPALHKRCEAPALCARCPWEGWEGDRLLFIFVPQGFCELGQDSRKSSDGSGRTLI